MTDDELLNRLAEHERELRPEPEWDEVLRDHRNASSVVERLVAEGLDADEARALAQACTPLDDAQVDELAHRMQSRTSLACADEGAIPSRSAPPIDLTERRVQRRRRALVAVAIPLAAAAVLALWLAPAPDSALPAYDLTIRNDTISTMRGIDDGPDTPHRYLPTSMVDWMLNPKDSVEESLELAVVIEDDHGQQCLARPSATRLLSGGAFEIRGALEDVLGLVPGHWRLSFVIESEGTLPIDEPGQCKQPRVFPCPCSAQLEHPITPIHYEPPRRSTWLEPYEIVVQTPQQ